MRVNKIQSQVRIIITMNKYTYLLSDCYRNASHIDSQTLNHSFSYLNQQPYSSTKPAPFEKLQPKADSRLQRMKREYSAAHYQKAMPPLLHRDDLPINLFATTHEISSSFKENQKDHSSLQNRLHKLINLGQRHEQALKEVDLQSKLKRISDKYSGKQDRKLEDGYQQYKRQRHQSQINRHDNTAQPIFTKTMEAPAAKDQGIIHKEVSFSKLPQSQPSPQVYLPIYAQTVNINSSSMCTQLAKPTPKLSLYEPDNVVTRTSVKAMISEHLNQAKQQNPTHQTQLHLRNRQELSSYDIANIIPKRRSPQRSLAALSSHQENMRSMQKLSNLQERIKSSIKPYLNI